MKQNYCYILCNDINNDTYVGYTIDWKKRLRQHNGELVGGARFTTARVKKLNLQWKFLVVLTFDTPLFTKNVALSFEWHLKHQARISKAYRGPSGRLLAIPKVLQLPKFKDIKDFYMEVDTNEAQISGVSSNEEEVKLTS